MAQQIQYDTFHSVWAGVSQNLQLGDDGLERNLLHFNSYNNYTHAYVYVCAGCAL